MSKWTTKELLEVLDMSEFMQKIYLVNNGILGPLAIQAAPAILESLAETAFRMKDEVIKNGCDWLSAVCEVINYCQGQEYCDKCGQRYNTKGHFSWADRAQPIHWIIAALIAEVRKEEEIESGKTM